MGNLKPSEAKPWLKYFPKDLPTEDMAEKTLYRCVYDRNKEYKDQPTISYFGNEITYGKFFDSVKTTAAALQKSGVKKGDVVTMCSVMLPEIIFLFYALDYIGATPNLIDPRYSTENVREYINRVESKLVVTIDAAYPRVAKSVIGTKAEKILVVSPADSMVGMTKVIYKLTNKDKNEYKSNVVMWKDFFASGKGTQAKEEPYDPNHVALIVYTGGTTGSPKGVMLPDKGVNSLAIQYSVNEFKRGDRFLNIIPPFVAYGFSCGIHLNLTLGIVCCVVPKFDAEKVGDLMVKYHTNHTACVPMHYQNMLKSPKLQNADLSFIVTTGCGGDAINTEAEKKVNDFLASHGCKSKLCKGWGMTEVSSTAATCTGDINKLGSVGIPLCMTTIGIFEPGTENELDYNTKGEVCICTPNRMLGYYNNPEESAKVLRKHSDGKIWVHTGDVGRMDEDGFIFIEARIKRIIIRHDGFKIFPFAIENVVAQHPDIAICSAVAMDDPEHAQGKYPRVFIVLKDDCTKSTEQVEKEVRELCEKNLAEYVQPYEYRFVSELPYTPTGKVDYRALELRA